MKRQVPDQAPPVPTETQLVLNLLVEKLDALISKAGPATGTGTGGRRAAIREGGRLPPPHPSASSSSSFMDDASANNDYVDANYLPAMSQQVR